MARKKAIQIDENQVFKTPHSYAATGILMLVVAGVLAALAIQSGSLLQWSLVLIALVWGLMRVVQAIKKEMNTKRHGHK